MAEKYVGKSVQRTEDARLIPGLAHYVDDIKLPDTLHAAFVRSMYAHAKLKSVDVSEALKAPGVGALYTGKEISQKIGAVPCGAALPDLKRPDHRVLATNRGYFEGHPIAGVVADDKDAPLDATNPTQFNYTQLPLILMHDTPHP